MTAESHADEATEPRSVLKVQKIPKRKWTSYIWDTFDKSPEERRLLFKLDTAILTFASLGLAESTFYPGMQYIIGSWYRRDELAKRSCIFHTSSGIASMFSGYLMEGVYHLGGRGGFKGWQW
ncbi:Pantothenate transporter liz1 [Penicillium subrubescens]|uniref:Pantothenate transporter liz1 n=1 Tax=Penicillium subrubescens TaxID=1316194 RepID=A0A1Q5TQJ9_9EURO|nr:Pantothenate transporter liz1 [Penicillium subrubescens]